MAIDKRILRAAAQQTTHNHTPAPREPVPWKDILYGIVIVFRGVGVILILVSIFFDKFLTAAFVAFLLWLSRKNKILTVVIMMAVIAVSVSILVKHTK